MPNPVNLADCVADNGHAGINLSGPPSTPLFSALIVLVVFKRSNFLSSDSKMPSKSVVVVPGSGHQPAHYKALMSSLEKAGYIVKAVELPSMHAEPAIINMQPDIEAVHDAIEEQVKAGQEVVVFAHSYGGMLATTAVKGLLQPDQKQKNIGGGIISIVYCAAFVPSEGQSVRELSPFPDFNEVREKHVRKPLGMDLKSKALTI
jgi:pimeloyl-ACP methyl ester carboxylesterase